MHVDLCVPIGFPVYFNIKSETGMIEIIFK